MKVAVAIYVADRVELVRSTIRSVYAAMQGDFSICLLADGVELSDVTLGRHELAPWVLHFPEAVGAPACLNAWIARCGRQVDAFLFLENGLVLGYNCTEELTAILQSADDIGLAGPSTNMTWNQQLLNWRCGPTQNDVHALAEEVRNIYGGTADGMGPLFSLGDFCLMFKREVVEAIGGADTGFGLGPCWEMDFHARAERAGYRGVHAKGAYCWRAPHAPVKLEREEAYFEASKRHYQNRLCGLQLLGTVQGYEAHCKGDTCEHFAPRAHTRLQLPLPPAQVDPAADPCAWLDRPGLPLISCIMPTAKRPQFVELAIGYFMAQDYPHKELIIVYDQASDLPAGFKFPAEVRLCQVARPLSIGNKRNRAIELARGELIALWDDDDWFHPARLRRQVMPILQGWAEISALQYAHVFTMGEDRFWKPSVRLFHRMYKGQVMSGNILFRRSILAHGLRYPDISLAEDAYFLEWALTAGARMAEVHAEDIYIYIRHGENTWKFREGLFLQPNDWHAIPRPEFFKEDHAHYHRLLGRLTEPAVPALAPEMGGVPLVSCIMPTADRIDFIQAAIQYFLQQDYPHKELIILDDGRVPVQHVIPSHPAIRYHYSQDRQTIGAKRNAACALAQGPIIMHWDDDDWAAPTWISTQVRVLEENRADITGLSIVRFFDPQLKQSWQYEYPEGLPAWVGGATLCYRKAFWQRNPFPEINIGEDNAFLWSETPKLIVPHGGYHLYAARVHHGNTSVKRTRDPRFKNIQYHVIEEMMR